MVHFSHPLSDLAKRPGENLSRSDFEECDRFLPQIKQKSSFAPAKGTTLIQLFPGKKIKIKQKSLIYTSKA